MTDFDPRSFLKTLTTRPGVYRMLDANGAIIYVGKARNLKNRVSSYFRQRHESAKTRSLMKNVASVEVTITATESEALLLESNLIKEFRPRYNVLFRDDKSYPYLYLSTQHEFPGLGFYRGPRKSGAMYFGPYPGAGAARNTLSLVQKLFRIRQCDDAFFRNRTRPCLQYQIKRCSAPCVGYIDSTEYAEDVRRASLFLKGRNEQVIESLMAPMQEAASNLEFEKAALYRDQIATLRELGEASHIDAGAGETDIIACAVQAGQACVQMFHIRNGRNLGNRCYFPVIAMDEDPASLTGSFIKQYYLAGDPGREIPARIYVSPKPEDARLLEQTLADRTGKKTRLISRPRGKAAKWIRMAEDNAAVSLQNRMSKNLKYREQFDRLGQLLETEETPERIECFDISHISGDSAVASCVAFGVDGAIKSDYRRYNIDDIKPGDDYAAMHEVICRRYTRLKKEEAKLPDLVLIDGGKGQLACARNALKELQLDEMISVLAIAKGPARKAGEEQLFLSGRNKPLRLPADSILLHLLQEIRDEAHRFAVSGHRQRRKKKQGRSVLEEIPGIGKKRRQQLIQYFGGIQGVERAGPEELAGVPGISRNLAQKIYNNLHT